MPETLHTERTVTTSHTVVEEKPKQDLLSSILAIAGLVILAIIVIWGLLHLATLVSPSLSSLFSRSPKLTVSAPESATSGIPFTVRWKYSTSEKGAYAFLYPCKDGLKFETPSGAGAANDIPCGSSLGLPHGSTSLSLTPRLSGASSLDVPLSIAFIPSATSSKRVQGSATTKIHPAPATAPAPSGEAGKARQKAEPEPAPLAEPPARAARQADLSVAIISATADQWGNATVVFDIGNVGGSTNGSYTFSAQLPTRSPLPYSSPLQSPLNPGDHVVNTLRFSQATAGVFNVSLNASDANQSNNFASQSLVASYYNNSYNPNAYPQPYNQNQYQYAQPYYQY